MDGYSQTGYAQLRQSFTENKIVARKDGNIAGTAREKLESEEKITVPENYLQEPEVKRKLKKT